MGLFKQRSWRTRPDGTRYQYVAPHWSFTFKHPKTGERVRGTTGVADRQAAKIIFDAAVNRAALEKAGLVSPFERHEKRPLAEHLADWETDLRAGGCTDNYAGTRVMRVRSVLDGCGFTHWGNISATAVKVYLAETLANSKGRNGQNVGTETRNHYLSAVKGFTRWMLRNGRAASDPLVVLMRSNSRADIRHDRRALEPDELRRLLTATRTGPARFGVSGAARHGLYLAAASTGLRARELASLRWVNVDLNADPPTVTIEARHAKNRRADTLPLADGIASTLREWKRERNPGAADAVFEAPHYSNFARMLRQDMRRARAHWIRETQDRKQRRERRRSTYLHPVDDAGRVVDFHSLRHAFASNLAAGGVTPKVAMDLLRHSDINLTLRHYTHTTVTSRADALRALPDLTDAPQKHVRKADAG